MHALHCMHYRPCTEIGRPGQDQEPSALDLAPRPAEAQARRPPLAAITTSASTSSS